ncbi:hypothetical protein V2O64_17835 [Verrucomicrobiaceae bacterium 227]
MLSQRMADSAGAVAGVAPKGGSHVAPVPTDSDRRAAPSGILTSRSAQVDDLLATIASPRPPSIQDVVEEQISEAGPRAAAEAVRDDLVILPVERLARIEEIARQWSLGNPGEVWDWIVDQSEEEESSGAFKQAAISGYIESVALSDPGAAANASELLDPTVVDTVNAERVSTVPPGSADPGFPGDPGFLTRNRK